MTPEEKTELKNLQLESAEVSVHDQIRPAYSGFKTNSFSSPFNPEKQNYNDFIVFASEVVKDTLKGKTQPKILETLNSLIEDDSTLLSGLNSVLMNTDYFVDLNGDSAKSIESNYSNTEDIFLEDNFVNTKNPLEEAESPLYHIKRFNSDLQSELLKIFNNCVENIAAGLSEVSAPEVEQIAKDQGLYPDDNIMQNEVDSTNTYADSSIENIEKIIKKIDKAYFDMHKVDKDNAANFYSAFTNQLKEKRNNEWSYYMKHRDKKAVINQYMTEYGFTKEEAELLYQYDVAFVEYANKNHLDPKQASYEYSMLLASFAYKDAPIDQKVGWKVNAGIYWDKGLKDFFTEQLGFTEKDYNKLDMAVTRNYNPNYDKSKVFSVKNKNGKGSHDEVMIPDENGKYSKKNSRPVSDYENTTDLAHVNGAMAIMIKDDIYVEKTTNDENVPNQPVGASDDYATFKGDIASGSNGVSQRDARADADAQNRVDKMRKNGYRKNPVEAGDNYHDELYMPDNPNEESKPNQKRMQILAQNYGGTQNSEQNTEALSDYVHEKPKDEMSLTIQQHNGVKEENKDADVVKAGKKMWGYIEEDLSGANG